MESYHIIVLVVASVSLILVLTIVGILIKKDKGSQKFPTSHKDVPDGWTKAASPSSGTVIKYILTHTGTDNNPKGAGSQEFIGAVWKDIDICKKKEWADKNLVYWDGITTYNGC